MHQAIMPNRYTKWLKWILVLYGLISVLMLISSLQTIAYASAGDSIFLSSSERYAAFDLYHSFYLITGFFWIVSTIFYLLWVIRTYQITLALGKKTHYRNAKEVAVVHLIPFLNFYGLYLVMKELYNIYVKDQYNESLQYKGTTLLRCWWIFWSASFFLWLVSDKFQKGVTVLSRGGYINNGWLDFWADLCDILVCFLLFRIVSQIGAKLDQITTKSEIPVPHSQPPVPSNPSAPVPPVSMEKHPTPPPVPSQPSVTPPPVPPQPSVTPPKTSEPKKQDLDDTSKFTW